MSPRHAPDPFDALLADHRPFADSDYLREQVHVRYQQRLGKIAELLPIAGVLSEAIGRATAHRQYRTIGDPVVRHAIHQALRHVWNGPQPGAALSLAECEEIFQQTLAHLEAGTRSGGPLESGGDELRRLGKAPYHGAIWSEARRDDVFARSFRRIVHDNFGGDPLCVPSAADLSRLSRGAELLGELLPACARSVLSHAHLAVVVPHVGNWRRKGSCSEFRISGTIFLNREMLENPWWVAEHLLHESLHQKLYDFRHTHSLLAEDLSPEAPSPEQGAIIQAIWNVGGTARSNGWDTFRAIAAFHVYVHLALFGVQVSRRRTDLVKRFGATPEGVAPAMTQGREAFERAQYLGRSIKDASWKDMGPAGRLFVAWLGTILRTIDPVGLPADSRFLHLVLNRYTNEATWFTKRDLIAPEVATRLMTLVDDEALVIRQALLAVEADPSDLQRLDEARARAPEEEASAIFLRFRRAAAEILHRLSPDGYGLGQAGSALSTAPVDEMIRAMVDASSEALMPLLSNS